MPNPVIFIFVWCSDMQSTRMYLDSVLQKMHGGEL